MSVSPGSAGALRMANQRRVLDVLRIRGSATQAALARETGLAAGTVSSIVRALAEADVVTTIAGSGRRGTKVQLGRAAGLAAAVDFGHSHVGVGIADMAGLVLGERWHQMPADYDPDTGLDRADALLADLLDGLGASRDTVRNAGMGLPSPIHDGVVLESAILPAWSGLDGSKIATDRLGMPVLVDNDANLGALGEHRHGIGRGHRNLVFAKVSSGVGAGLIVDDRLYRGTDGTAGEIGHLTLDEQGPLCRCGSRGCLEAYAASGPALTLLAEHLPTDSDIDEAITAAKEGSVAARRVFEDAGLHLGWGLAMVANVLNPAVIAVAGNMSRAGDLLLESARIGLRRHVLAGAATTPIELAELADRACLVGGLVLAIDATDLLPD